MPHRHLIFGLTVVAPIVFCFGATPSAAQPLPDVIVTSLSYAGGVFTSTVKNQGAAATPAGIAIGVGYSVDGVFRTWGGVSGPLAAGASVTIGTNGGPYTIPNGTHTITAHVDDVNRFAESNETNNLISQSITVGGTDTQAPTVVMTAPANGTTVSGPSATVSANASDNVGVSGVQFKLDGANLGAEDTSSPYSISWNNPTNGSHTLTAVARDAAGNTATSAGVSVTVNNTGPSPPDVIGQWSLVAPLPYFPVHTHMLRTGKVMIWPGDGGVSGDDPQSWDPANQSVSILSKPGYDLFCSGHSFLADGTLFVAGGHVSNNVGLARASTYNPVTNAWSNLPDMNKGRWYPTTTVLANGDVLVVSGDIDLTVGVNTLPQVFQVATGTWRNLTSAQLAQDLYPMMLLAPNGQVFNAGPTATTRYLDTSGTGAWSFVAARGSGAYRSYGSAVMYAPGKVLVMGGDDPPTNTAEVIDLNAASPSWSAVGSMQFSRRQINATLLPDGRVLVTGGTAAPGFNEPSGHVDAAELWDPATETWTTLASSSGIPRVYHSAALLLPDGRVLSTGGNGFPDTEIYSPPYLFKGTRPTITSAPASIAYGQSFIVKTDAAAISKIRMLRLSSVTHAFNQSQYINDLSFSQTAGDLNVTAPLAPTAGGPPTAPTPVVAPPGYYLLFILNGNGVPSVARIIQLGGTAPSDTTPPTVALTAPASGATVSGTAVTVSATAADNVGIAGVQFKLDGANLGAEDTASPYSVAWDGTTTSNGSHTLTGVARDAAGNTTTSAGVTVTVNNTGPSLPDVIVTSLSYAGGVFTSTVKNQGAAATPAGIAIGVGYSVDGVFRTWGAVSGPLAAGASVTIGTNGGPYTIPNGTHTITAHVDDVNRFAESNETNNQLSQSITVGGTDTQAPTVSMTAPASGTTVSGPSATVSANASDNVGVSGVQFKLDGANLGAEDTASPYSVAWDSTTTSNGSHTLTGVARDAAGNTTTSAGVTVTVNNTGPSLPDVIVTSLSYAGGVFTSTVKNQGAAATPAGIAIGVGYSVDGVLRTWGAVNGPLAAGASVTVDTNGGPYTIPNGTHTITAHVDDVNRFAESNETNNLLSQSIAVP